METKNEEKKVAEIPTSITIGEITYVIKDTPELKNLIASVAQVEKSKLYSTFESLKQQVNQLGEVQVVAPSKAPLDVEALKAEIVSGVTATITEMIHPLVKATQDTKQQEIDNYRESIIKANLDKCIPELVKGTTKEEINASLQESIALRAKYVHPLQNSEKVVDPLLESQEAKLNEAVKTEEINIPKVPKMEVADGLGIQEDIKSMSMEEFAAKRNTLLNTIQTIYPT